MLSIVSFKQTYSKASQAPGVSMNYMYDTIGLPSIWHSLLNWVVFAQSIKDPDLLGNWQKAFDHFIQSGQVWALLIGLVLGYVIRGLTSYG